ncbi:phage tail tape measure protein [Mycobacteroides sp. PCS013]|uniref:phage tail tape measure protein n=1 Tax=Mycobacteroides sp. PCS013 TaxID=3074106 RepID=UPI003C2D503C
MAGASDPIGYYPLQVIPVIKDIDKAVNRQMSGPLAAFGRKAGADTGKAFASGLESAKARVQSASNALAKARKAEEDAVGRVRVAEAKLQAARDSGKNDRVVAAEEALARVRRAQVLATQSATNATRDLAQAQNAATAAATRQAGIGSKLAGVFGGAASGAKDLATSLAGKVGIVGAGAAVTGMLSKAFTVGMDYTRTMNTMASVSGATADQMAQVSARARELGNDISLPGTSANDAANAMTELAKGGFNVQQAMDGAKGTLQLAAAAGISAGEAATIQANALNAFGLKADFAGKMADILANAANASSAEITDIAYGLQAGSAVANQFGISANDTAAALALLANNGIKSSDAGTLLKSALLHLAAPSDQASGALDALGVKAYDAQGNFVGLQALMGQLQDASKRLTPQLFQENAALAFGSDAARLAGIGAKEGAQGFAAMAQAMGKTGAAADVAAAKTKGLPGAWERVQNSVESFALSIYDVVKGPTEQFTNNLAAGIGRAEEAFKGAVPVVQGFYSALDQAGVIDVVKGAFSALFSTVEGVVTAVTSTVGWFNQNRDVAAALAAVVTTALLPSLYATTLAFARQAAVAVGYNALVAATKAWTAAQWLLNVALNANPVGLIITGLVALGAAVVLAYRRSETFRNIVQGAWNGIKVAAQAAWTQVLQPTIKGIWEGMQWVGEKSMWLWRNVFTPTWEGIKLAFTTGWDIIKLVIDKIRSGMQFLGDTVSGIASGIGDAFRGAFNGVVGILKAPLKLLGMFLSALPDKVFGFDIPGASAVKSWGQTLQSLNTGGTIAGRTNSGVFYGPGTGTSDSLVGIDATGVPTVRVSKGEGVVNAGAMGRGGSVLVAALNAGWVPSPEYLNSLVGLAGGGVISADQLTNFASGVEGKPYVWGGTNWGDCSGAVSALANYATGMAPFGSRFATATEQGELAKRGFKSGLGPAGSLNIGWVNGGPGGGHTAATLPDGTNFEMGGRRGNGQFGGAAAGAGDSQFTQHAHLPPEYFGGLDAGAPTYGGGGGGAFRAPGGGSSGGGGIYRSATGSELSASGDRVTSANTALKNADQSVDDHQYRLERAKASLEEVKGKKHSQEQMDAAQRRVEVAERELADATERQARARDKASKAAQQDSDLRKFGVAQRGGAGGGGLGSVFGGGGGSGGAGGGGGGDLGDLIKIFGGGILETFGLDGSWLPDIRELGVVKMADAIMGIKGGQSPDGMELPQGAPPIGAGAGDGVDGGTSYDASVTINGNVGYTPEQVQGISERNQNRLRGRTPVGG